MAEHIKIKTCIPNYNYIIMTFLQQIIHFCTYLIHSVGVFELKVNLRLLINFL